MNSAQRIEHTPVSELVPYAANARTHSEDQINLIAASIKEFGFNNPVLIDTDNGIIAGHGRVMAAMKLGLDIVPTVTLDHLNDVDRRAYILADNRLALDAGWDDAILSSELKRLEGEIDLSLLGFDDNELAELLRLQDDDDFGDEDIVPDIPETAVNVLGDVWLLGDHRLMCGDSTDTGAVMALMDGQKADQMVTDPPYNVEYVGKTKQELTILNDSMTDEEFRDFLAAAFKAADNVMKAGAVFYIWHAEINSGGYNFRGACMDAGWKVRQCLVWDKNVMVMGRQDYHWKHEPCLYGWKGGAGHLWATDRKQTTVLQFDRPTRSKEHPTMKPVALIEYQILNNTKGEDIVLDLFGGAGSTLIACEKNNRICFMMELDPKYCDVIINRWQDYTGKQAIHAETGKPFEVSNVSEKIRTSTAA